MAIHWTQNTLDELALWYIVQHSVSAYQVLMEFFKQADHAIRSTPQHWQQLGLHKAHPKRLQQWQQEPAVAQQFELAIRALNHPHDYIISQRDAHFPKQLLQIADPPPFLFIRGNPHILSMPQVAIVGSRKPSQSGRQIAEQFATVLAQQGFCISSGLAHGIDTAAHQGALRAGQGQTIAVMGTGINLCYPSANQDLYQHIIDSGGALISEFIPNSPARDYHFPRRNRIVSGLSLGVLVVEAAIKSGSLITAQTALDQNRQVFAIPGHIYNEQSRGCHQLIRDGAMLVDDPEQIIHELDLPRRWQQQSAPESILDTATSNIPTLNQVPQEYAIDLVPEHLKRLYNELDWVGRSIDDLVESTQLDTASLTGQLMELELLGFVVQQAGLYQRCRQ